MDQVSKLSITVLCYYACLPEAHNNKTTGYSYHTVQILPCPWPCQLTHPGTAVPRGPLAPSQPSFTFSPTSSYSTAAVVPGSQGTQASIGRESWIQCDSPSSNIVFTPAFTICKGTQDNVLNPHNKIKYPGQQSVRMGMPLSQVPFNPGFCSTIQQYQLSFKTQIPKLVLMLWSKIWLGLLAQFFLAGMLDIW